MAQDPNITPEVRAEIERLVAEHPGRYPELAAMLPEPPEDHTIQPVEWVRDASSPSGLSVSYDPSAPKWKVDIWRYKNHCVASLSPEQALDMADALIRNASHALGLDSRLSHGGQSDYTARTVLAHLAHLRHCLKTT